MNDQKRNQYLVKSLSCYEKNPLLYSTTISRIYSIYWDTYYQVKLFISFNSKYFSNILAFFLHIFYIKIRSIGQKFKTLWSLACILRFVRLRFSQKFNENIIFLTLKIKLINNKGNLFIFLQLLIPNVYYLHECFTVINVCLSSYTWHEIIIRSNTKVVHLLLSWYSLDFWCRCFSYLCYDTKHYMRWYT